jgi:hypothetical protein
VEGALAQTDLVVLDAIEISRPFSRRPVAVAEVEPLPARDAVMEERVVLGGSSKVMVAVGSEMRRVQHCSSGRVVQADEVLPINEMHRKKKKNADSCDVFLKS